ncbi:hypothetical protein SDC9_130074 [bioreactor metagenome]|uniref:Uncharacterized protein n=1 Tax=bioreactor metagenome TaxID=1076179 RepID=A0A645D1J7_9ZZZZ
MLTAEELTEALCQAPSWWNDDPGSKHNAIFVIAPASSAMIMNEAGETKPAYEQVAYSGSVIFWSAPLATFTKTRWSGIVKSSVYPSITIRNRNTALKLQALANQLKED